jgi:hypothetical protein
LFGLAGDGANRLFRPDGLGLSRAPRAATFIRRAVYFAVGPKQPLFEFVQPLECFAIVQLDRSELVLAARSSHGPNPAAQVEQPQRHLIEAVRIVRF